MEQSGIVFARPKLSMTIPQAAEELGISRSKLEQVIKRGLIRCHNLEPGGDRRISWPELNRYIASREDVGIER